VISLLFAIGSKNPAKVKAAKSAVGKYFKDAEFLIVDVDSGVDRQPIDDETETGARNRAAGALKKTGADFGIGIEGGLVGLYGRHYATACCVVASKSGEIHIAYSPFFELPQKMLEHVRQRRELGDIMDEHTGRKGTKQEEGALGILSRGKMTRVQALEAAVVLALMPFVNNELYE